MTNTNTNAAINNADAALIDDLFNDLGIDAGDNLAAELSAIDASSIPDEVNLDDLAMQAEAVAQAEAEAEALAKKSAVTKVEPEPEPEFDESLLADLDGVSLDTDTEVAAEEVAAEEVAAEEVAAPKEKKKSPFAPKLDDDEQNEEAPKVAKAVKPNHASGSDRVTYFNSSKSKVLLSRLGGNADLIILEVSDLDLTKEELQAKRKHLLSALNNQPVTLNGKSDPSVTGETVQKKVAEKVIQLFTYLNNGGTLNRYTQIAFATLIADGYLNMKKDGNMQAALIKNGYGMGTVRAQTGQISKLFPLLKIAFVEGDKLVPNQESIILEKMKTLLPQLAA